MSVTMSVLRTKLVDNPAALWGVSIALGVVVGLLTSSLFGVGLFLVLPVAVQWILRRA
jgi:uncharacterized protein YqhQ